MKTINLFPIIFLFATAALFINIGCHKDPSIKSDDSEDDFYQVQFDIQQISARINRTGDTSTDSSQVNVDAAELQYLYFWSFNNGVLDPDIAVESGAKISFNDGQEPKSFGVGWPFEDFPAGRSLTMSGVKELILEIPLKSVQSLSNLGFDISSSNTGPKAFDLYYSFDDGERKDMQKSNQFANVNQSHARNSFRFEWNNEDVSQFDKLFIFLLLSAGERAEGSNYNENTGALRLDNMFIRGKEKERVPQQGDQLHIYAFDQRTGDLAGSLISDYTGASSKASLSLPHGTYRLSFIRHSATEGMLIPANISSASSFYYGNRFDNHTAQIYGSEEELFVKQDVRQAVVLNRYYSKIGFQFTDGRDLSAVDRIVVARIHEPFSYAPFNKELSNPILDQTEIIVKPNFAQTKTFYFNQFLGNLEKAVDLSYHVIAYDKYGKVLKDFKVSASTKNNTQVLFRGELLGHIPFNTAFDITINEDWDDSIEGEF